MLGTQKVSGSRHVECKERKPAGVRMLIALAAHPNRPEIGVIAEVHGWPAARGNLAAEQHSVQVVKVDPGLDDPLFVVVDCRPAEDEPRGPVRGEPVRHSELVGQVVELVDVPHLIRGQIAGEKCRKLTVIVSEIRAARDGHIRVLVLETRPSGSCVARTPRAMQEKSAPLVRPARIGLGILQNPASPESHLSPRQRPVVVELSSPKIEAPDRERQLSEISRLWRLADPVQNTADSNGTEEHALRALDQLDARGGIGIVRQNSTVLRQAVPEVVSRFVTTDRVAPAQRITAVGHARHILHCIQRLNRGDVAEECLVQRDDRDGGVGHRHVNSRRSRGVRGAVAHVAFSRNRKGIQFDHIASAGLLGRLRLCPNDMGSGDEQSAECK